MLFILAFLFLTPTLYAVDIAELKDVINDPAVSRRCKALIQARNEKQQHQQKLSFMLLRNEKILEKIKFNQINLRNRLELNQVQIKNNIRLSKMRLESMEENIVRKGCPGLRI